MTNTYSFEHIDMLRDQMTIDKFMGVEHPVPVNTTVDARILVTRSRDRSMIGQVLPFEVKTDTGVAEVYSGGYEVRGPICDPGNNRQVQTSTLSGAFVAFPYEAGWLWGTVSSLLPERTGYRVTVNGGVGVPPHVEPDDGTSSPAQWQVDVPHVFNLPAMSTLPKLTDPYDTVQMKLRAVKHQLRELEVQGELMRALADRDLADNINSDRMPDFKNANAWHYTARASLVDVGNVEVDTERAHNPKIAEADPCHRTVLATRFAPALQTFIVKAKSKDEAEDSGREALRRWVKLTFTDSTIVHSIVDVETAYAGVVR